MKWVSCKLYRKIFEWPVSFCENMLVRVVLSVHTVEKRQGVSCIVHASFPNPEATR